MTEQVELSALEDRAGELVDKATKAGADQCDVVIARSASLGVSVREGEIENTDRSEVDEFALRVFCGKRVASVSANQSDDLAALAERAVAMAKVSPEDPHAMLAPKERLAGKIADVDLYDATVSDVSALSERALAAEEAGLAVEGVNKSIGAGASWGMSGFVLATSTGFVGSYHTSRNSVSAAMIAGDGTAMQRDYDYHSTTHLEDLKDAKEIGRSAGERTARKLNPRQVDSGAFPVVFDRRQSTGILASLAGAINGASVARKTSFLREAMGKQVAASGVTVICDPHRPRGMGSRPVDGEGIAPDKITFVQDGMLREWVLDCASADELGLVSNARATRSGSGTAPSTTNLYIQPGERSAQDIISSIQSGLYLTETIGHGINMVTGDYSKGADGFWIENGEIAYPVSEITIAGNLKDMFMAMTAADDLEFRYATNAPTLLVEGMTVGGR